MVVSSDVGLLDCRDGFRIEGLGFLVSGLGSRVSCFRFRV